MSDFPFPETGTNMSAQKKGEELVQQAVDKQNAEAAKELAQIKKRLDAVSKANGFDVV